MAGQWVIEDDTPKGQWVIEDAPAPKAAPSIRGEGFDKAMAYTGSKDIVPGFIRGAGSIGATLMSPFESSADNERRRTAMDQGLTSLLGADTNSTQYQGGKLGGEVLGTAGLGGGLANLLGRIPGVANAMPHLLRAISSGGMTTGAKPVPGLLHQATDMGVRVAGGAVNGALTAGAVNPSDADTGALINSAFPLVVKGAGVLGTALGKSGAMPVNPTKLQTARESMDAGYIIPPAQLKPTFTNRVLESISGKQATAQIASTKNQAITEGLTRRALGLADDAPLTFETMRTYRGAQHASGYEPLRQVGVIPAGAGFNTALDDIAKQYTGKGTIPAVQKQDVLDLVKAHKSAGFDSGDAVDAIRILRENASDAFSSGNGALGKANRAIADAYENSLDDALKTSGQSDLLSAYRTARQNIAKSATVEKAIREGAGTIDARILGRELQKGKPLTGELRTAAKFGNTFDKAAQPPHLIGSPDAHNLKAGMSAAFGVGGTLGAGPVGALLAAAPFVTPPIARSIMFRKGAQQGLLNQGSPSAIGGLLSNSIDEALPLMYRTNPLLANYGQ